MLVALYLGRSNNSNNNKCHSREESIHALATRYLLSGSPFISHKERNDTFKVDDNNSALSLKSSFRGP